MLAVSLLGAVEVRRDGEPVDLGSPQQRAVIAHLALDAGRVVSVERLIDRLWGEDPPRTPLGTLQSYVSRLRRAIEPARGAGIAPEVLVSEAPGYVLRVPAEQVDVHRFRALVADGRAESAAGRQQRALERYDAALGLWRGPALGGAGNEDQLRAIVAQLEEERSAAVEDRFTALLALGRHAEAAPLLQAAVDEHPLREGLWALLALALYRSNRQADALRAVGRARRVLLEELGLDPGPELRDLENRILAHDPSLALGRSVAAPVEVPAASPDHAAPELVGRADEWSALTAALTAAATGQPQFVLLEGEPGMGKSTLSGVFLAHAATAGWRTAMGHCVERGLAPSLWPCIEIVRSMIADDGGDPANPLRRAVAGGPELSVALTPVETADHFTDLLDGLGGRWVVLLDDLHWADQATLDMLRLVLDRVGGRPILVIGAHRPPELASGSLLGGALGGLQRTAATVSRVRMSELDADAVGSLIELTSGATPTHDVADRVRARAGGNPLFVTELARLAGERGLDASSDVPEAIRDVVRARLAQLPERATAELEVAAVLGERFDLRTAIAASERDADGCLDALDAAIVTRILVPEGDGFRFAHALVRDAVLADVSPLRLARLHHRVAEAILAIHGDTADTAEPVAHHRLASASFAEPVVVSAAAVRASDVARWRNALEDAGRYAEQALEVLAGVPRSPKVLAVEVEALEAIVSTAYRRNDPAGKDAAAEWVRAYAERAGSDAATALTMFLAWGDVDGCEDLRELAGDEERSLALAGRTKVPYAVVITRYMLAAYDFLLGRFDEAAEHAALAIEASGATDPDQRPDHVPLVMLPVIAGAIAAMRGEADEARTHSHRRAAAWLSQRREVDATAELALAFNRALIEALLGDPQRVLDELAGITPIDGAGFVEDESATCAVLGSWARARLGDASALGAATAAMDRLDATGERVLRSALRTFVADAYMAHGDPAAVALLEVARREALARGEVWWLAETLRLAAEADRRFATGSRAAELLKDATALATEQGAAVLLPRLEADDPTPAVSPPASRPARR